jgi:hypothetical protein
MPCINDYTDEEYNGTPVHKCRINKCVPYPCDGCAKDNKCYIEQSPAAVHPPNNYCTECGALNWQNWKNCLICCRMTLYNKYG